MLRKTTFTLTPLDMRRASRLQCFGAMREPRTLIRLSALWIFVMVAWAAILLGVGLSWSDTRKALLILAPIFAVAVFVFPFALPLALGPLIIRRRFRQEKRLAEPVEVRWDDDVYDARERMTQSRVPWGDYVKWRENAHCFTLHLSDVVFQVLPKRALTAEQIVDIRTLLQQR